MSRLGGFSSQPWAQGRGQMDGGRRGGSSRQPLIGNHSFHSSTVESTKRPAGDLIERIDSLKLSKSDDVAQLTNFECIASYNWLNSSNPVMMVPGSPPIWSPPPSARKIAPDKGKVFIDQNAARYKSYPLEPTFRAIYNMNPTPDLDVDAVICRNTMAKLFDFVTMKSRDFEIEVEIVGETALFVRKEKQTTEFIDSFRGFGRSFPDEYTRWESTVKNSSSHHRVAKCMFAGLRCILRFECDGYLQELGGPTKKAFKQPGAVKDDLQSATDLLSSSGSMTISEMQPTMHGELQVRAGGHSISQSATIEIKTRAAYKTLDMEDVLPRLWVSQTSNLVVAYHKGGRFDDVKVKNVKKEVEAWEARNAVNLRKLNAVIRKIIDTVRSTISMKCRITRFADGDLEIRELDVNHQSALPDDLCERLRAEGYDDEGDMSEHTGEADSVGCEGSDEGVWLEDDDTHKQIGLASSKV